MLSTIKIFLKSAFGQKIIIILIIITQIVSILALMYFYSFIGSLQNFDLGKYDITYELPARFSDIKAYTDSFLEKNKADTVYFYLNEEHTIFTSYLGQSGEIKVGNWVDNTSRDKQAISFFDNIGDSIELLGETYTVVGVANSLNYEVNFSSFNSDQEIYGVEINYKNLRSAKKIFSYGDRLEKSFKTSVNYEKPAKNVEGAKRILESSEMIIMIFVIISAAVSFTIGYGYIIEKSDKVFLVLKLIGQSKRQLLIMTFSIIFISSVFLFLFSASLYAVLDATIIPSIIPFVEAGYIVFKLNFTDYAIIAGFYSVFVSLIVAFYSLKASLRRK